MFDKYLIANEYGFNGVYRAKLIRNGDDIRAYIPGINSINPFDEHGNINMTDFEKNKESYPQVQWCCYNIESKDITNIQGPAWVMFENGDVQRPVCISYAVIGGESESSNGGSSSSGSGINGGFTTVAGEGVILIQGPVNDSRNTKYSDVSQVPQTITQEWSISECLSQIQQYANQSSGSNSIVPIAKAIVNAGGAKKTYTSALGIDVVTVGNAVLCATTNKFGIDGDYLWAHFTDGTECLFVRFDEKSTSAIYGLADPANEWGHWVDYENGFGNATTISILEICGMNQSGLKKTCDYMVNLGSFLNNPDLAFKSLSEVKSIVDSKISKVNGGSGNNIVENAKKYLGVPYVYGGTTPTGFDCSGLTQYVYNESGITIPRVAADQYKSNSGQFIDKSQLQPGDLVFFTGSDGNKSNPGHVGIYVGNNQMIHAPSPGKTVRYQDISTSYYVNSYVGAKRYN